MRIVPPRRIRYSRAEHVSDGVVHLIGLAAALWAVPILIARSASLRGDMAAILGTSIYGATLIAMIACSAAYNMSPPGAWTNLLRRLDHSAIYFKIAGAYTPFTLLSGGHGALLLAGLWGAAVAGTGLRVFAPERTQPVAIALYLAMGWAGLIAGQSIFAEMSSRTFGLIVFAGLVYTAGLVFYFFDRLPFHYTIWHLFVLAASAAIFAAVSGQVSETAMLAART